MKVCCEYCGQYYPETEERCPYCGAPNNALTRSGRAVPRTIEELKSFCAAHRLPLEQMRFFIGEDYHGARAFGIYKDDYGVCTVYKNKSDGSRAVRYRGTDEAHAVSEIYQKLKSEIQNQREHQAQQPVRSAPPQRSAPPNNKKGCGISLGTILIVLGIFAALCIIYSVAAKPSTGYYSYGGDYYYYQNDNWYQYDNGLGSWYLYSGVDDALQYHAGDYYESYNWSQDYGVDDFSDSAYYGSSSYSSSYSSGNYSSSYSSNSDSKWDSDWDDWNDSDWDWSSSDSWDSDWTDWDSDW